MNVGFGLQAHAKAMDKFGFDVLARSTTSSRISCLG